MVAVPGPIVVPGETEYVLAVPLPIEIEAAVKLLAQHRVGELQNHLSKLLVGQGMRKFLEATLIPLNEAVHERVVRGEMENFQENARQEYHRVPTRVHATSERGEFLPGRPNTKLLNHATNRVNVKRGG